MSTVYTTASVLRAGTYDVDPIHSRIGFAVKHLGINVVRGRFATFEGTIEIADDARSLRVGGSIEAASVDTGFAQRDEHLRTADFFDVQRNPTISFSAFVVTPLDQESIELTGEITIRGITKPVTLAVQVHGSATDQYGNERLGFTAKGRLARDDFRIPFDQASGGIKLVANAIDLELDVEAIRRP